MRPLLWDAWAKSQWADIALGWCWGGAGVVLRWCWRTDRATIFVADVSKQHEQEQRSEQP